jgi:hypothetical protein
MSRSAPRRWRGAAAAVGSIALAFPVGYALAQEVGIGGSAVEQQSDSVPAAACPAEVNASFAEVGLPRDAYGPNCPTPEQAAKQAQELHDLRAKGLIAIAESIRKHGGPEDAAELSRIESELERLHASGPEE